MKFKKKIFIGMTALSALALVACSSDISVKVESNDGTAVSIKKVENAKELIKALGTPTKKDFVFAGWYTDSEFTQPLTDTTKITSSLIVYAKWNFSVTVYTNTDGGSTSTVEASNAKDLISRLTVPTRANYVFAGWYLDEAFDVKLEETSQLTSPVEVFARWRAQEFTVKFVTNGGTPIADKSIAYDTTLPTGSYSTTRDGYTFVGWFTDSDLTKAFKAADKIKAATTLYAKWDELKSLEIATADELITYLSTPYTQSAVLTADIDMADKTLLDFPKNGEATMSFSKKFDGAGFTISNLTSTKGLFNALGDGAIVTNIKFENVVFNAAAANDSIIANQVLKNSVTTISDITINGLTFVGKFNYNAVLVGKLIGDLTLTNISIVGSDSQAGLADVTCTSYFGVIGIVTPDNTTTPTTSGILKANDILLSANINGSSQGNGGLLGQIHDKCLANETKIEVDGYVFNGSIKGDKNSGAVIGDSKHADIVVSIKNVVVHANVTATGNDSVGIVIGQIKNADKTTFENVQVTKDSKAKGTTTEKGITGSSAVGAEVTGVTLLKSEEIVAPNDSFTIENRVITFLGLTTELPESIKTSDVENGLISAVGGVTTDLKTLVTGEIAYITKAVSGQTASNAVKVTITPDATVTDFTDGTYTVNGKSYAIGSNGVIEFYLPVTSESLGLTFDIEVVWNLEANAQTYQVEIASDVTFEAAPAAGEIALSSQDSQGLTASVDENNNTTLNVTEGTIVWDEEKEGNYVTVEVTRPSWSTSNEPIVSSNATFDSITEGIAIITVKISGTSTTFTVNWSPETNDDQVYTITCSNDVVITANPNVGDSVLHKFDLTDVTTPGGVAIGTNTTSDYVVNDEFTVLFGGKFENRPLGDFKYCYNTGGKVSKTGKSLKLVLTGSAKITVYFSDNGNAGRYIDVMDNSGTLIFQDTLGDRVSTKSDGSLLEQEFNFDSTGTFFIGANNGLRIYGVKVEFAK